MDFKSLKYNGQVLYTAIVLAVAGTWIVAAEYWDFKYTQKSDAELLDLKVQFLLTEIDKVNGRLDRKTNNNITFFKRELERIDSDQINQWDEINTKD